MSQQDVCLYCRQLRHRKQRGKALIALASPEFREQLQEDAIRLGLV